VGYRWYRDTTPVTGALGTQYRLGRADVGRRVKVRLVGSRDHYLTTTAWTVASAKVRR
jgi:hypothetical protein